MEFRIIVLIFLLQWFRLANCEKCQCISYVLFEDGLSKENIVSIDEYTVNTCDGNAIMACKTSCVDMYRQLTDDGNTCMKLDKDTRRVADWMCEELNRNVCNARVGVFVKGCGSDPVDTGFRFKEPICCKSRKSVHWIIQLLFHGLSELNIKAHEINLQKRNLLV